ncbi:MAG: universal stress protein [Deinococcus-Thermus bacterium]|jgi:nucleotide-binding universal stress UspA family protein|nr:universal stress protein [Deinococcota bacterium]
MTERLFRHLLVPADGSDAAIAAARLAFRIARSHEGHVDLLYVLDTLLCEELRRFDKRELDEIQAELLEQGRRTLQVLADEAERMGIGVDSEVRRGDPFEEIVAHAREHGSDLIVMGHVGRRPHKKVLLGSVAERVVEFAPCPVMVVKHEDTERSSRRSRTPIGG